MKQIIYFLGVAFLTIIIILNIIFTANLDANEHITIAQNSIFYVIGLMILGVAIYFFSQIISKHFTKKLEKIEDKEKRKKQILVIMMIIYAMINILWVICVRTYIVGDQAHVANLAQALYGNHTEEILNSQTYAGISLKEYIQAYSQQIPLAFIFSIFFRILHFDIIEALRALNVISNILTVIALYKITKQLSKKYETNKILLTILSLTFFTIPMLATFVYGDIPSIACCLFSVYFMMKYQETKQTRNAIFSAIFMMIAYMLRMNSLIFIIATIIYMVLNIIHGFTKRTGKQNLLKIAIVILYLIISLLPANLIKNYYLHKYGLEKNKSYPSISYFLMSMEESPRANGWYQERRGEYALKNGEKVKKEYQEAIQKRLTYFLENPKDAFQFYIDKISSMWTENTYSAIRNNTIGGNEILEKGINTLTKKYYY